MILETTFPAHIRSSDGQAAVVQTCEQHSRNAASFAAASLQDENLFHSALLAGLVHDMGKYKPAFRSYIEQAAAGNSPRKGSVIHTFAGVRYLLERFHTRESAMDYADIAAEILAYAAGAHHGLFDIFDASGACGFLHRLQTGDSDDLDAMQNFCAQCASESELNRLFHRSVAEIKAALEICQGLAKSEEEFLFYAGLLVRLLCSAVIDGDRRDTAMFMNNAVFPDGADSRLWERLSEKLAEKLRQFRTDSPINQTRRRISDLCNNSAPNRPGIYRLHIPTGGEKTLSSLRYALAHAAQYRKKRIIFTFPLLSIIEQNSAVLRDAIGDDSIVLEHYSNVVSGETGSPDETARREQLIDSWDAPIIITTLVQLLNTLFDAKTACIRRFHALTDSVIIIDEVQTLPYHMLTLFNLALTFLAEICHATVILCSATQPCTEQIAHPIGCTVRDLICCDEPMRSVFRRTELIDAGSYRLGEIPAFAEEVRAYARDKVEWSLDTFDRYEREARSSQVKEETIAHFAEAYPESEKDVDSILYTLTKEIVRDKIINRHIRPDGRKQDEIRPIWCETGILPRTHGSAVFTRGQTQVMTIATLGCMGDGQTLDGIGEEDFKRYIHHYNMPPYSVGETRPVRSPGRREIGHGALAERALLPMIPSEEEFPYAIRLVSEVVSSNGSTSQASICASTMALMDAGVPIKKPVAGVAMGLIKDDSNGNIAVLTDIQGLEDFLGDMDFKVAGTKDGITAIQMDIKIKGIDKEILTRALEQARQGRLFILNKMLETIPEPRKELSPYAPRILQFTIHPDKIREVIGSGGKTINGIIAETGVKIDIEDDGTIYISAENAACCDAAKKMIDTIVFVPEVGMLYYGKVVRILNFGAFVELAPGKDGMVHISKLDRKRVEKVEDVVTVGDMIWVKFMEIDEKGRWNLSRKDALLEIEAQQAAAAKEQ